MIRADFAVRQTKVAATAICATFFSLGILNLSSSSYVQAQELAGMIAEDAGAATQAADAGVAAAASPGQAMEDLIKRLEEAEMRLNALEWNHTEGLGATDPSSEDGTSEEPKPEEPKAEEKKPEKPKEKAWYEKVRLRGYTQVRINDVVDLQDGSAPAQYVGDSSVGDNQEFLIRRARLIIQGDVSDHVGIYLQPDFAVTPPGSTDANHFVQIRDWYADLYIDKTKVNRIRVGQSKIPFGWENMQSSSQRLPLDRADALNSAARNERDLGVFYYWTPEPAQAFFDEVNEMGLKGSNNYGVFGIGFYNGQGGSFREQNDNLHFISRFALPVELENGQHLEFGIQGYTGRYVVLSSPISPGGFGAAERPTGTLETGDDSGIRDERIAATFVYYPQPWGFQAEWNVGRGPGLNDAQRAVIERDLHGGYAMTMYRIKTCNWGEWFPFYRYQYYEGGYKAERNAPFSYIDEHELGMEWQLNKYIEFVSMYTITDRTNTRAISSTDRLSYGQFQGELLRFQLQFNY